MTLKLLIDECLSPKLVAMAVAAGHVESTCVRDRGWLGLSDWRLIEHVVAEDFTLVTANAKDFRGHHDGELGGLHNGQPIHAGLICLNAQDGLDLALQEQLFEVALDQLRRLGDLVNQALEITLESHDDDGAQVAIELYEIPET